jgi:carboxyl-terminal processing protease
VAAIGSATTGRVRSQIQDLTKAGAQKLMIDLRRTSGGQLEQGIDLARLFVSSGTLAMRETRGGPKDTIAAASGDGAITAPVVLLIDAGTSAAAELFASALVGNKRADLVGEHTIGRVATQKLVKLPDGAGLWLSTARYLTPAGNPLHEKGLEPTVAVDEPDVEFGQTPPPGDPVFDKALERLTDKKAA